MKNDFASAEYAGNDFFVATTPSGHAQVIELDGERSAASSPMELVQVALATCSGADVISVLRKKRQQVTSYRVEVRATRREEHPRSYATMQVKHIVRGHGISERAVEHAVQLSTDKYCGVVASLRPTVEITAVWEIHEEPLPKQNGDPE
ncbi:MAG: OsmC family protein [Bryobacteraceae bacterium]